jgi:hypothetical protein
VELWHCSADGVYDNSSDEYRYRAKTYCDEKGNYSFQTILPVPYDTGSGTIRPAHFHLLISAKGYQSLVTQLYFTGDPNNSKDSWASSPQSKRRTLDIKDGKNGEKSVQFDITMLEKLPADPASIDRLTGKYISQDGKKIESEFFKHNNELWVKEKNDLYGYNFEYVGDNTFRLSGDNATVQFDILPDGSVKATQTYTNNGEVVKIVSIKAK